MENNLFKYIVYETTNLVNNKIYIGVHKTTDPYGWDLYLGCGIISTQPCTYQYAKTAFQFAVKKYGPKNFRRKTIAVFDTLDEAFALERLIVNEDFLARDDVYNMVLGGDGGAFLSNQKKVYRYDLQGNYLEEFNSITEAAVRYNKDQTTISRAIRYRAKSCDSFWCLDKVEKLDISLYVIGDSGKIRIYKYNKSGEFIQEFDSMKEACSQESICRAHLRDACEFGLPIDNFYYSYTKNDRFDMARKIYLSERKVYQYNATTGEFIAEFNHQKDAEKLFPNSNINKSIRLKQDDGNGFRWLLFKVGKYSPKRSLSPKKTVIKIDLNGNVVKTYESGTAAIKAEGAGVQSVLRGERKYHKQHMYKYVS